MIASAIALALLASFSRSYCSSAATASSAGESLSRATRLAMRGWRSATGLGQDGNDAVSLGHRGFVFELLASFFISDRRALACGFEIALRLVERLRRERVAGREWRERTEGAA